MPLRRSRRRLTPASGRSLTPHPDRVGPGGPAVLDRVPALGPARADLVLVGQGERVVLMGLVAVVLVLPRLVVPAEPVLVGQGERVVLMGLVAVVLVLPRLVGRAVPVELDLARLVAPAVQVPPVDIAPVDLAAPVQTGRAAPADLVQTGRAAPADRAGLMSLVDRAGLADRAELMDLAAQAALAVPNLTGRVDLAVLAAPVDHHRRRTSNTVSTIGVAPRWAAPGTCRTDSARRIMGRRLRPGNTDSAGTVGLPPVLRRRSGMDHHLQVAGVGLRLPVVGTVHGMVRRVTGASRSVITGRSITTVTTRSRCSTRYSAAGASGSSACGSRCTDLTARSPD